LELFLCSQKVNDIVASAAPEPVDALVSELNALENNHLTAVQLNCELVSQIEERKIRNDAAYEERKRKKKKQEKD
jgi:hypothetical protein